MSQMRGGGSATYVMELEPIDNGQFAPTRLANHNKGAVSSSGRRLSSRKSQPSIQADLAESDRNETLPSPTTASAPVERWNSPRINIYRLAATFWSFVVMGMNDAAYGAIIPYLETYYHLSYTVVSLIFLSPLVGYNISALLNNSVHLRFGQRGVALVCPVCHLIAYIVIAVHPPYPVLVIVFMLAGFGNGLSDAAWNAWIGDMPNANEILGFLHGFYGLGATISPLIATAMITKANLLWYNWYYIMVNSRKTISQVLDAH